MPSVTLRPVEDADLGVFFAQQLDGEARRMAAFTRPDLDERAAFDAHWTRIRSTPTTVTRTVLHEGKVAGYVARWLLDGQPQVSYWLGRAYWGKGVATAALSALIAELGERPLYARAAKDNHGSRRVLEKCGFRVVGTEREFAAARGEETEGFLFELGA
ncbi:MAG: GNAT family N-acetyltransferase [Elusimicrobia bacterium]|nr:GNAT family N-acetyltransferase [Elusimicrobiota bacterium]